MSQEDLELVRRAATAFAEGEFDEAAAFLDPQVELYPPTEDPDVEPVYRGRDGARAWLQHWLEAWEEFEFELEELVDAGDRIVIIYRQRGKGKGSGVEVENRLAGVATVENGKVVRGEVYLDVAEALRLAAKGD